jgi:L-lactate dehydrogenase (cytochrome)
VYDLSSFLSEHPGGAKVLMREAGRDGTAAFEAIHPTDMIQV